MYYDFGMMIDRIGTNASKWNKEVNEISMTIADMDFRVAPCILDALQKRVAHGIFGYSDVPTLYFESYQAWWLHQHNFTINTEWMLFSSGVVPAISSIIRKVTTPGEQVLIQAPVYNIFYNSIINNGRTIISSDLRYVDGKYEIDFGDLEKKLKDPQTTLMILCNPHNPTGNIWSKQDLLRIGELCDRYHVLVISDEIHCDITEVDAHYTPFASINEQSAQNSITMLSVSKAFNLAGLQAACIVVANPILRHKIWRGLNTDEIAEPNAFACEVTIAALQHGQVWLQQACAYISANKVQAKQFLAENIPQFDIVDSQATYLLWIDCGALFPHTEALCEYLSEQKGLYLSHGSQYGKHSDGFIRMNIACPHERLIEGLHRLKEGCDEFMGISIDRC